MIETTILCVILVVASAWDVKKYRIPNWITFPAMIFGLAYSIFHANNIVLRVVMMAFFFLFGMVGFIGLGDIKLIMAAFAWGNPPIVIAAVMCASMIAIVIGEVKSRGNTKKAITLLNVALLTKQIPQADSEKKIPFAPCLLAGYIICTIGAILL